MPEDPRSVERYLHTHIPITAAMEVAVLAMGEPGVRLGAPLAPNVNHRSTVFGGSAVTLAILSAWTLIHLRLQAAGRSPRIVIQRSSLEYLHPITGDFEAFCPSPGVEEWERFVSTLDRRGRGRITLRAEVASGELLAGSFTGVYVAIASAGGDG